MRPCLHQVDLTTIFTRDVNVEEFLNIEPFPCRMLSEFGYLFPLMPVLRNNKDSSIDDEVSVVFHVSQLEGKIFEFTDQCGNKRESKFIKAL